MMVIIITVIITMAEGHRPTGAHGKHKLVVKCGGMKNSIACSPCP